MPGTLLPHEILTELTEVAGRIVEEVLANGARALGENDAGPALYLVEHSIDATVLGLSIGRQLMPEEALPELGTGLFLQDIGKLALPPSLVHPPTGCHFHPRCPYAMPMCRTMDPELLESNQGHLVACHLPVAEKRRIWRELQPKPAEAA